MRDSYFSNFLEIEKKQQLFWKNKKLFKININDFTKKKKYILGMCIYPSGDGLHLGHVRVYTASDILSRYWRMKGYNVLHPIGWDSFGLPAEQFSLLTGNHPLTFTLKNINNFRKQLKMLGFSYDYENEINTCDPNYYKWTQWIFLQLFQNNLAKLKMVDVNFCPQLGTVLANEEVIQKGGKFYSERGSFPIKKVKLKQWVLKITKFADKLLNNLRKLPLWPLPLKKLQEDWIGKKKGVVLNFQIIGSKKKLSVFTTRVDTIFGITFLAVDYKNKILLKTLLDEKGLRQLIKFTKKENNKISYKKNGFFTNRYATHPFTGEKIEIWATSNYLSSWSKTNALMGVPAHSENDYFFAKKYKLTIKKVISAPKDNNKNDYFLGDGKHINSYFLNGLNNSEAQQLILEKIIKSKIGRKLTIFKLRDWIFSRQRYWGEPFPIVYQKNSSYPLALQEKDLPLELPYLENPFKFFNKIKNIRILKPKPPLSYLDDWVNFIKDDVLFKRETNVMPQWAGSSWYFLAYILKKHNNYQNLNEKESFQLLKHWMPVDIYLGGKEHAVSHFLYARFWNQFLYQKKIIPHEEPFINVVNQGIVLGTDNQKMSKSKGNVVNPDELVQKYGADSLRIYIMFIAPFEQACLWDEKKIIGAQRWLNRIYQFYLFKGTKFLRVNDGKFKISFNLLVKRISENIENYRFNICVSEMMSFTNKFFTQKEVFYDYAVSFLKLLSLFAPHLSDELWQKLNLKGFVLETAFPEIDNSVLMTMPVNLKVQIDSKFAFIFKYFGNLHKEEIITKLKVHPQIKNFFQTKKLKRIIYKEKMIINFLFS